MFSIQYSNSDSDSDSASGYEMYDGFESFDDWDEIDNWNESAPHCANNFSDARIGHVNAKPLTNATIHQAVIYWFLGDKEFGPIEHWDVSNVTDMSGLFLDCSLTNIYISGWNMTNVLRVSGMFGTSEEAVRVSDRLRVEKYRLTWDLKNATDVDELFSSDVVDAVKAPLDPVISELIDEASKFNKWDSSGWESLGNIQIEF